MPPGTQAYNPPSQGGELGYWARNTGRDTAVEGAALTRQRDAERAAWHTAMQPAFAGRRAWVLSLQHKQGYGVGEPRSTVRGTLNVPPGIQQRDPSPQGGKEPPDERQAQDEQRQNDHPIVQRHGNGAAQMKDIALDR